MAITTWSTRSARRSASSISTIRWATAPALVGPVPAGSQDLPEHGRLAAGVPARLIVFNARSLNEIVSRPQSDRIVIGNGRRS